MAALCGGAALLWMLQHQKPAVCPRGHPHPSLAGKEPRAAALMCSSPLRHLFNTSRSWRSSMSTKDPCMLKWWCRWSTTWSADVRTYRVCRRPRKNRPAGSTAFTSETGRSLKTTNWSDFASHLMCIWLKVWWFNSMLTFTDAGERSPQGRPPPVGRAEAQPEGPVGGSVGAALEHQGGHLYSACRWVQSGGGW